MIVIILGILDILAGLSIFTLKFTWGATLVWFFTLYLIGKSLPFFKSIASILDMLVAAVFVFTIMGYAYPLVTILSALWLIQKGIVSFF